MKVEFVKLVKTSHLDPQYDNVIKNHYYICFNNNNGDCYHMMIDMNGDYSGGLFKWRFEE